MEVARSEGGGWARHGIDAGRETDDGILSGQCKQHIGDQTNKGVECPSSA